MADIMSFLYMPWDHAHSAHVVRRSVAITMGTSVDRRRSAPNSQKDCLLSYIASILQGPSGSAGACWASTPHAKAAYIPLRGGGFDRYMGHYVFMHFAPSFLPSRAARVTRIRRSNHHRRAAQAVASQLHRHRAVFRFPRTAGIDEHPLDPACSDPPPAYDACRRGE